MFLLFFIYRLDLSRVFYDAGGDEYEQIPLFTRLALIFKKPAKARDISKAGGLVHRICNIISYETADYDGILVLYRYGCLGRAFQRGGPFSLLACFHDQLCNLLEYIEADKAFLADLRGNPQGYSHIFVFVRAVVHVSG